ncbi:DNA replication/repair protein RecF [Pontivivens insulae]|uniref:DNA replication and repair protein RecF n=1 Tax=Pontivivens insulae TaxID=1639689 RepID=A0A2R8A8L1_9RHOB|nr:DNA replication/repair protein RecF [Pontivivens insulae]RED18460.1 DNA replication and repair protein RecF [Pontivivens insulae]SPF28358.1 DNA replication and repair protein RecF [Pontivivens insulae]
MPHITSLKLSMFRSHKLSEIDVDARPIAIHGPNGAGKTNILEAISMLSPGRGLRRVPVGDLSRAPERLGWQVRAGIEADGPREIVTRLQGEGSRTVEIDGKTAPQTALAKLLRIVWLVPSMDRLWLDGASERRRFLDRMSMSFFPDHAEAVLGYERAMRERNRLLKDQVRDPRWYEALEEHLVEFGSRITASRRNTLDRLGVAQDAATTAFPAARLSLIGPDGAVRQNEDDLAPRLAEGRGRDMAAGRTLNGPHRDDLHAVYSAKDMEARDCSTGEQKALLVSVILSNARALSSEKVNRPVLLLDEIGAHLDAGRRSALYDEIIELGAQAWMTGTGAELFESLEGRAQFLQLSEIAGETKLTSAR